uniref:Transcription regulator/ zinc ion binding n=1 Tax=Solanum tuberosum TaxID=4113 RepID=M1B6K4_SOLTU
MAITGRPSDNGKSTEQRVVGVSEVKSNLVADGVRLVKNLNDSSVNVEEFISIAKTGSLRNGMPLKPLLGDDKLHAKKRKREIGHKKDVHAKKSAKTTEKEENKKQVPVEAELGGLEPKACANGDSAENLKIGFHELEQENEYGEDDDSFRDNDDDSYYGYGTGYYNNSEDFDADY